MPGCIRPWLAAGPAGLLAATLMLTGCLDASADRSAIPVPSTSTATLAPTPTRSPQPTPPRTADPWARRSTYTILFLGGDGGRNRRGVRTDSVIVGVVDTK